MMPDTTKPKRKRAPKKAPVFRSVRDELTHAVSEAQFRARTAHRHGDPDATEATNALRIARNQLARRIALELDHNARIALELDHNAGSQGIALECYSCGASGAFDVEPIGPIFGPLRCRAKGLVLDGTETLDQVLTRLGYTHTTSKTPGRKDIHLGALLVYVAAHACDVWAWLRERGEIGPAAP